MGVLYCIVVQVSVGPLNLTAYICIVLVGVLSVLFQGAEYYITSSRIIVMYIRPCLSVCGVCGLSII